jgi:hypothetical protein
MKVKTKPVAGFALGALLLGAAACGQATEAPDGGAAGGVRMLVQKACSTMITHGGSVWAATAEGVRYAAQAAEASGGWSGLAGNVAELYFAANVADLFAASQTAAAENHRRIAQLRTAVLVRCESVDAIFPPIKPGIGVAPYRP